MDFDRQNNNLWTILALLIGAVIAVVAGYYILIGVLGIAFSAVGVVFYFLPSLVAMYRQHRSAVAIFVLNLLLGWTLIAWAIAMVWACTNPD